MHSRRRLITLAAVAGLTLVGLTACRSSPTVAAYVGDTKFTEERVTAIADEAKPKTKELYDKSIAAGQRVPQELRPTREMIVQTLVLGQLCEDLKKTQSITPVPVGAQDVATLEYVSPDTEYAELRSKMLGCMFGIKTDPVTPTDAQVLDLFERAYRMGLLSPDTTIDQVASAFQADEVKSSLGIAKLLSDEAARQNVSVNPRYRTLPIPIFVSGQNGLVEIESGVPPIGQPASDAVVEPL